MASSASVLTPEHQDFKKRKKLANQKLDPELHYDIWKNAFSSEGKVLVPKGKSKNLRDVLNHIAECRNVLQGSVKAIKHGVYMISIGNFKRRPGELPSEEDTEAPVYCTICSDLLELPHIGSRCTECGMLCCHRCRWGIYDWCWLCRDELKERERKKRPDLLLPGAQYPEATPREQQLDQLYDQFEDDGRILLPVDYADRIEYDFFPFSTPTYLDEQAQREEVERQRAQSERESKQRSEEDDDAGKLLKSLETTRDDHACGRHARGKRS